MDSNPNHFDLLHISQTQCLKPTVLETYSFELQDPDDVGRPVLLRLVLRRVRQEVGEDGLSGLEKNQLGFEPGTCYVK